MTQNELLYVKTVAEVKNISKAAKKLYISQPSLTNAIQKIESNIGNKLFIRTNNGLILTEVGEKYYSVATNILNIINDLELEISDMNEMKKGKLSIGITSYMANKILPIVLPKFESLASNIEFSFEELTSDKLEEALCSGDIQFAIMHRPQITNCKKRNTINFIDIVTSNFILATQPNHPLCQYAENDDSSEYPYIDFELFKDEPFILGIPGQRSREVIDNIFANARISPYVKYTSKSQLTIGKLVSCGLGVSLVPELYLDLFAQYGFKTDYYRIDPRLKGNWTLSIAVNKNAYLSKAAKLFIKLVGELYDIKNLDEKL